MKTRHDLIVHITKNKEYINLCKKVSAIHYDDIFQELSIILLTIEESKLPQESYFNRWFYRVAYNLISKYGTYGKNFKQKTISIEDLSFDITEIEDPQTEDYKDAELLMLDLPEFDNRVMHLYNKLGNMKKVEKETGISYSVLRRVKDRLK